MKKCIEIKIINVPWGINLRLSKSPALKSFDNLKLNEKQNENPLEILLY